MFDCRDHAGHEAVFKLNKGDGFPVHHAQYALVLLSTIAPSEAKKSFADAVPLDKCEFVIVEA
jgi:hypothetical protein